MNEENSFSTLALGLRAALFCVLGSMLVTFVSVLRQGGFGANDLRPFFYWTLMYAGLLALAAIALTRFFSRLSRFWSYLIAIPLGGFSGFLWVWVPIFMLGPWIGAFGIPILSAWMAGGASGLIAVAGQASATRRGNLSAELVTLCAISLLVAFGAEPLVEIVTDEQTIKLTFLEWQPDSTPHELDPSLNCLSEEELAHLASLGLEGHLTIHRCGETSWTGASRGPLSHTIFVIQRPLESPVTLSLANKTRVVYVQEDGGWRKDPPDAPTIERSIRFERETTDRQILVNYWVEVRSGSYGGIGWDWLYENR